MSKFEFMSQLESLLSDVPLEEREAAIKYYEDYFEDAGSLNEQDVVKELVSPERVAAIIKSDLTDAGVDKGEFTEHGYRDNSVTEERCEIVDAVVINEEKSSNGKKEEKASMYSNQNAFGGGYGQNQYYQGQQQQNQYQQGQYQQNQYQQNQYQQNQYQQGQYQSNQYQQSQYQNNQQQQNHSNTNTKKSGPNIILIIALVLLAVPVGIPLVCSAFGLFVGLAGAMGGLFIAFLAITFALVVSGIAIIIWGFTRLFFLPAAGALLIGLGLILLAIGLLFTLISVFLCTKVVPTIVRGFVNLCKLPFKNRSVTV